MTRLIFDHKEYLFFMSITSENRSRAAKLGWIGHDLAALKRSCASVKGWNTRRHG